MNGCIEVARLKQRLDATFQRVANLNFDLELQSDFSRYLCVLVSGYLEKAVTELILEHARRSGAPSLQRFVEANTRKFTNAKTKKLQDMFRSFDPDWGKELDIFIVDDLKDAVDSVVSLRHQIAHGVSVGVTYHRILEYYKRVQKVIQKIADLCVPA